MDMKWIVNRLLNFAKTARWHERQCMTMTHGAARAAASLFTHEPREKRKERT